MIYSHLTNRNFEDLSCGRVIYNFPGCPNFPARLAGEIFLQCLDIIGKAEGKATLYDPCCGGAYLLTVLGFLCGGRVGKIYASDISQEAAGFAAKNLGLLTAEGLNSRKEQLIRMYNEFHKQSHADAIKSAERLSELLASREFPVAREIFTADVTDANALSGQKFKADVIITDVPYGRLTSWISPGPGENISAADKLLTAVASVLGENSVAAVVSDKGQRINHSGYESVKKINAGKRKIEFLKVRL